LDLTQLTDFATQYAAAWSSRNPDRLSRFYAEDAALRVNEGQPAIGRAEICATAHAFMVAFPDMVVTLESLEESGSQVIFHWRWTGTNSGPGGTGRAVDLRGYEEWTFDSDGLIVQSLGHFDEGEYGRQVNGE
jgi:steroid delta-isomerase-like uncharacterized protein